MSLFHDMEVGEEVVIGDNRAVVIRVQKKTGRKVRLAIDTELPIVTVDHKNKSLYDGLDKPARRAV